MSENREGVVKAQAILLSLDNKKRLRLIPDELTEAIQTDDKNRAFALVEELKRITRFTCNNEN